jgi:hypothetical protein
VNVLTLWAYVLVYFLFVRLLVLFSLYYHGNQSATLPDDFFSPGSVHDFISVRNAICLADAKSGPPELDGPVWVPSSSGLYLTDTFSSCAPVTPEEFLG